MHLQPQVDSRFQSRWFFGLCGGLVLVASGGCAPRFKCAQTSPPDTAAIAALQAGVKSAGKLTFDPQDAQIAIDPACSTVCYEYRGEGWESAVFGTIDLTLPSDCAGPARGLTLSKVDLRADDFVSNGHAISDVKIWNQSHASALWKNDNTFATFDYTINLYIGYKDNGEIGGHNDINSPHLSWGTIDPDYQKFTWAGSVVRGEWLTANFNLCGHPVARPPVPALTPTGVIQQNSTEGSHITFSAAESHDPDDDIKVYRWRVDNQSVNNSENTLTTVLPVGDHMVAVEVQDSRGVRKTATGSVTVQHSSSF